MNKLRLFVENFLVYGLGGIISKIIPLIMVPIVTRIMPSTAYYGISDLSHTLVQFGSAIAIMGMYDAMYRMFFEKEEEEFKIRVCSTAFTFTCITSVIVFFIMIIFRNTIAQVFFSNKKYAYVVYLSAMSTLVSATNNIIALPTRMENKRKIFLVTNTVSPLLSYSISIPLLLAGHYVVALPIASVLSGITMEITFGLMNYRWFHFKYFDKRLLKELLLIAIPLLPNFIVYWVFNSCDKVMITNMIGIGAAGIYSVGSKLGHASQLIYTAFAGGWQYFAFSTMKEKNQIKSNSLIFEYLGIISFIATTFMCALSYILFQFLFKSDYLSGFIVAPYLFFAPLLQMLFQVAANQFIVIKKTWPNLFILSSGAVINIILNYTLIPFLGIEGASIATLMGYMVSDVVCVYVLSRMGLMEIRVRFYLACITIAVYMILWRMFLTKSLAIAFVFSCLTTTLIILFYKDDLWLLVSRIMNRKYQE